MKNRFAGILLVILLAIAGTIEAAHLVGGEISYGCLGNNEYEITLKIYRDCNSTGAPFDWEATITIFDGTGQQVNNLKARHGAVNTLPNTVSNPCKVAPPSACVEYTVYRKVVTLVPNSSGYIITHQRCCRNNTISNIPAPDTWGSTYTIEIPPSSLRNCNNSPEFQSLPPITICRNDSFFFDHSAVEWDGDSLFYELCDPLHGGGRAGGGTGTGSPAPDPASPPPYSSVPFSNPYTSTSPLPSTPPIQIDPATGMITGRPTGLGQYVFAVCVSEYDANGNFLCKVRRDYQFNVTSCVNRYVPSIIPQPQRPDTYCDGLTIEFWENSISATSWWWDFGVQNTNRDTSRSRRPTFTFPQPGVYTITLVIQPHTRCADTTTTDYEVRFPVDGEFTIGGDLCFDTHRVLFNPVYPFDPDATYSWDFGSAASLTSTSSYQPPPITYSNRGPHVISLSVQTSLCTDVYYDTLKLGDPPIAEFDADKLVGCDPTEIQFTDLSTTYSKADYFWDFGDGETSQQRSPNHIYDEPGTYTVKLRVEQIEGCLASDEMVKVAMIQINPTPVADLTVDKTRSDIFHARFNFTFPAASHNHYSRIETGDGRSYENRSFVTHYYRDTGTYEVVGIVKNQFECSDTVWMLIRVDPVVQAFVPNTFTPDGNGVNDMLLPSVTGSRDYFFAIYDRWGVEVFATDDPYVGWNGKFRNSGDEQPSGVYSYIINVRGINDKIINLNGIIHLIR